MAGDWTTGAQRTNGSEWFAGGRTAFRPRASHAPVPIDIRLAEQQDAPAVALIVAHAFADKFLPAFRTHDRAVRALTPYVAAEMTRRGNYVFVGILDGTVVGSVSVSTQRSYVNGVAGMFYRALGFWGTARALFVLSFLSDPAPAPDEAYVEVLGVAPEYQRLGIGRALMVAAEAHARGLHKRRLTLYVTSNNYPAQQLYRSRGMHVQRRIPSIIGWLFFRAPGYWRMEKTLT